MAGHARRRSVPTRRQAIVTGGAIVGGSLLGGCLGGTTDGAPADETDGDENPDDAAEPATDEAYTVTMEPVGTVEFESVPERWIAYDGGYADMGVALGQAEGMTGIGGLERYYTDVYEELPGVGVDRDRLERYPEVTTKEVFYELENDVHLYDPEMLQNWFGWDDGDVEEVTSNVGPFVGNLIFRRSDEWHDYRYYTLYEAFEVVAAVFDERERFEAFEAFHDEFLAELQSKLPPAPDRPAVLLTYDETTEPDAFSPYRLNDAGTSKKQWRDLGVADALAGTGVENLSTTNRVKLDYEALLEIDPDVLLVRGHERRSAAEFRDVVLGYMEDHPVASELAAVRNGRVYRGGPLHQGPICNLFATERAAKQLYPDVFGDVTDEEALFDRDEVAAIVTGGER